MYNHDNIFFKSKPLHSSDDSAVDFVREMLKGDPTYAVNFDRIQWDNETQKYVIVDFLLTGEEQVVSPWESHPNRYFKKNAMKFISLWEIAQKLGAVLYLVNYAKKGTKHEDKVKVMEVISVDPNNRLYPVKTKDQKMTREQFSDWFRSLNKRGRRYKGSEGSGV